MVTSTGLPTRVFAADSPPKPAPTMTTLLHGAMLARPSMGGARAAPVVTGVAGAGTGWAVPGVVTAPGRWPTRADGAPEED